MLPPMLPPPTLPLPLMPRSSRETTTTTTHPRHNHRRRNLPRPSRTPLTATSTTPTTTPTTTAGATAAIIVRTSTATLLRSNPSLHRRNRRRRCRPTQHILLLHHLRAEACPCAPTLAGVPTPATSTSFRRRPPRTCTRPSAGRRRDTTSPAGDHVVTLRTHFRDRNKTTLP